MKKMTKKKKLFRKVTALAAVIALGASLAGCGSSGVNVVQAVLLTNLDKLEEVVERRVYAAGRGEAHDRA